MVGKKELSCKNKYNVKLMSIKFPLIWLLKLPKDCTDRSRLITLSGDVEENPGPDSGKQEYLSINSYNIRGLKEYSKLKRVLNKCAGMIKQNNNVLFNLQETHLSLEDKNRLEVMWRGKYSLSPGANKSRGCLILYDSSWDLLDQSIDKGGRYNVITIKKQWGTYTIINLYAPNDHSLEFFEAICNLAIEHKDKYDSDLIITGDFNLVSDSKLDSVNRIQTNNEKIVSDFVKDSFTAIGLKDGYRILHKLGGYTWSRGECMSRLDMIYVSNSITGNIKNYKLDWAFDRSDHAMVQCNININNSQSKGPGLPKVDPGLLDNLEIANDIKSKLKSLISEIPNEWNPHNTWEYIKTMIRSLAWEEAGKFRKSQSCEEQALISQINRLNANKSLLVTSNNSGRDVSCDNIDNCIKVLKSDLHKIWEEKSKALAFKAKVKWFDEGEKSNRYFLNIIKKRGLETTISRIQSDERTAVGQKEVQELIKDFYSNLYSVRQDLATNYDSFYPTDLNKLDHEDNKMLCEDITLGELEATLKSCKDSAPGPDGIPYKYYMKLWEVIGPYLLDAWKFSKITGELPLSQRRSTITLLPKEGKDLSQIGNWRPITLSNCDLKVITKTIANRVSKVLDKIISPTQTAYIPGRVVHDNVRMFEFYRKYCEENNVEGVLMSMDAKKAFDSVDHKYMFKTLRAYGFSEEFIEVVKLLYKDIEADILVNGYRTCLIKIQRCVKQGDAFSCALFIICIDPLIRNIQLNKKIKAINLQTPLTNEKVNAKTGAFADDVGTITRGDSVTINEVFCEYRRFSSLSGIELNETKTEIMEIGTKRGFVSKTFHISNGIKNFQVNSVEAIKICGITFSNNADVAYTSNVTEKLDKFKKKLRSWQLRGLTLGGKILVSKVFGISQLIYSMQACNFKDSDLLEAEAFMFKFLWSKSVANCAPDRIRRSILKLDYEAGGLKVTDLINLNKALKLKQFFRANQSNHPIKIIQRWMIQSLDYDNVILQEYSRITKMDSVVSIGQICLNQLSDILRIEIGRDLESQGELESYKLNLLASTDITEYLNRRGQVLIRCFYKSLFTLGIENLKQLVMESTYPRSDNSRRLSIIVLKAFPDNWISLIKNNIECNDNLVIEENIVVSNNKSINSKICTVAMIKNRLLAKVEDSTFPFMRKLNIVPHDGINPFLTARKVNHSINLKSFKFRLLHMDIFTKERMFKYKMTANEICDFCGMRETVRHVLWDCQRAKSVWEFTSARLSEVNIITNIEFQNIFVGYNPTNNVAENVITRISQMLLRIDRNNPIIDAKIKCEILLLARLNLKISKLNRVDKETWLSLCDRLNLIV